ncbi:chromatin associated protein KTI12 [Gigaspora margarita]|uniref:Chromatin associated protein KTI12 n=1 Tax=Gigaspora margarita TaxID=4874 RepID=A0A8H4AUI3_GIGMA|nr:chromatin associated protein KTI12 [Gigaspora margarita]
MMFSSQEKTGNVHLINDESLGITKDIYKDTRVEEKKLINCGTPPIEIAREWNSNRGEEVYEATIFDDLSADLKNRMTVTVGIHHFLQFYMGSCTFIRRNIGCYYC